MIFRNGVLIGGDFLFWAFMVKREPLVVMQISVELVGLSLDTANMNELPAIVFMGSDAIGLPVLKWLHTQAPQARLVGVVSQPDKPSGRGQKLMPNPIAAYAREAGLVLHTPEKPDEALSAWLLEQKVELVVVMAYGHLLKRALLALPSKGFVNLHGSILPRYRGASPIQSALACGETQTGVTLMRVEVAMDAGAICDVQRVSIEPADTSESVYEKLAKASVPLMERHLGALLSGKAIFTPQDHALATYTRKLNKDDGRLDFQAPAYVLRNRIQALDPWPGSFFVHGDLRLKVRAPQVEPTHVQVVAGTVLGLGAEGLRVATGQGVLILGEVQRPGAKMMPAADFLRGYTIEAGCVLASEPMASLLCEKKAKA